MKPITRINKLLAKAGRTERLIRNSAGGSYYYMSGVEGESLYVYSLDDTPQDHLLAQEHVEGVLMEAGVPFTFPALPKGEPIPVGMTRADVVAYVCEAIEGSQEWALGEPSMVKLFDELMTTKDVRSTLHEHIPDAEWAEAANLILTRAPHHKYYQPLGYWLHVEDLADAYIGPFDTPHAALAHYDWTKEQGDGAAFLGISNQRPEEDHPLVMAPEQDKSAGRTARCSIQGSAA